MIKNTFAKLFDEYLNKAGLTDEVLAEQLSVSKMTIYNWRVGKIQRPISRDKLLKCADILKLMPKQRAKFLKTAGHQPEKYEFPQPPMPVVGVSIIQPYQFFGRESLLNKIYWAWHKTMPESIVILGAKRSGKTSLLNYLLKINQATQLRPDQAKGWPDDWLADHFQIALVDFKDANMSQPETLVSDVLHQLKLDIPNPCDIAGFSTALRRQQDNPTVILMDDIEVGLAMPALDAAFWGNMCSLGSHGKLSFVITASEPLTKDDFDKAAPFFNLFGHTLPLEAFTESEARELIVSLPYSFSEEEIEEMLKKSGCWPEPLQKLCDARLQQLLLYR
ncbi:helix-turn-helix domain-containing protein [Candidatus Parabeggiatoa sp. HSG14]|uniref:helix-turn-helix domain-containing protein n=1 Tax=Candidatus Parabeggiatoa sp. HSG14 TaxID=3055593 RepID=UPI0025A856B9|nr:helix-turn-helix domain-containing protein [Thiotrichales bacterium HSG14]